MQSKRACAEDIQYGVCAETEGFTCLSVLSYTILVPHFSQVWYFCTPATEDVVFEGLGDNLLGNRMAASVNTKRNYKPKDNIQHLEKHFPSTLPSSSLSTAHLHQWKVLFKNFSTMASFLLTNKIKHHIFWCGLIYYSTNNFWFYSFFYKYFNEWLVARMSCEMWTGLADLNAHRKSKPVTISQSTLFRQT